MNITAPNPHPLDFDWRFTEDALNHIESKIKNTSKVLILGAPTLAHRLKSKCKSVTLVDRQPEYIRLSEVIFIRADILRTRLREVLAAEFDTIFLDPPWYLDDIRVWINQALDVLAEGGKIISSIWPDDVRPSAAQESNAVFSEFSSSMSVEYDEYPLSYTTPVFEVFAQQAAHEVKEISWRKGRILELSNVSQMRPHTWNFEPKKIDKIWNRFTINEHQIAVRTSFSSRRLVPEGNADLSPIYDSWVMPTVSRRNKLRNAIDIWNSNNFVARSASAEGFKSALERLIETDDSLMQKDKFFNKLINEGFVVKGPYWRKLSWSHPAD